MGIYKFINYRKIYDYKYEYLNKEQKEAVLHDKGPLLIVAGAGTGKTTVITQRIVNLIEKLYEKENSRFIFRRIKQ